MADRYKLIKFNIHSGLSYHEISKFFEDNDLFARKSALDELKKMLNKEKKEENESKKT